MAVDRVTARQGLQRLLCAPSAGHEKYVITQQGREPIQRGKRDTPGAGDEVSLLPLIGYARPDRWSRQRCHWIYLFCFVLHYRLNKESKSDSPANSMASVQPFLVVVPFLSAARS